MKSERCPRVSATMYEGVPASSVTFVMIRSAPCRGGFGLALARGSIRRDTGRVGRFRVSDLVGFAASRSAALSTPADDQRAARRDEQAQAG